MLDVLARPRDVVHVMGSVESRELGQGHAHRLLQEDAHRVDVDGGAEGVADELDRLVVPFAQPRQQRLRQAGAGVATWFQAATYSAAVSVAACGIASSHV